jgi:hypothetical protein
VVVVVVKLVVVKEKERMHFGALRKIRARGLHDSSGIWIMPLLLRRMGKGRYSADVER